MRPCPYSNSRCQRRQGASYAESPVGRPDRPGTHRDGEVCICYKTKSLGNDAEQNFGVKRIPLKDSQVTLTAEDALVVVAEDDL